MTTYREALKQVAKEAGMTPKKFEKRLKDVAFDALTSISPQCLLFEVWKQWPDLSENLVSHARQCRFCFPILTLSGKSV